ncbi:MAG: hypothetical protein AAGC46_08535 [Solirubrobacteraceae bacterium]|nr:hypothetical protein [Patulibacter sp.]
MRPLTHDTRVPDPTASFWVMTVLATMTGATAADALRSQLSLGSFGAGLVIAAIAGVALVGQQRLGRRIAAVYWSGVALVGAAGALVTVGVTEPDGMPPEATAGILAIAAAAVLMVWARSEGTLSLAAIGTPRRERFYWLTILLTSALGSAVNVLVDDRLALGNGWSELIFAAFLVAIYAAYKGLLAGAVASFWLGYVLVRPLATTIAWSLARPTSEDGLGLGPAVTTLLVLATMSFLLAAFQRANARASAETEPHDAARLQGAIRPPA